MGLTLIPMPESKKEQIIAKAQAKGITLSDEHWRLLEISFAFYKEHQTLCTLRSLIKLSGLEKKRIYRLFPGNPIGEISQITGLPMPKEC